jgi:hypothetical protein
MRCAVVFLPLVVATAAGCSGNGKGPPTAGRIEALSNQVEQQRQASEGAVATYTPTIQGKLDDLKAPAADVLRQLPGVAEVEVLVAAPKPTHRIVHLRDWHHVPADLFAADVRQAAGKPLSDEEVGALYREHLLQVELVQTEQEAVLRCLVRHHGLKRALAEGLTPKGLHAYREVLAALRATDRDLADLRKLRAGVKREAPEIDREIEDLVRDHRRRLVEYGAASALESAGEVEALPLDDDALLDASKPVSPDGKVRLDPAKIEARHDGQVKAALASGPCSLLILGGAHDLSASVRRLGGGTAEYLRVSTARYKEVAGAR